MRHISGLIFLALSLAVAACSALPPTRTEIPVGGLRAPSTRQNLAAARERMSGGLLEPGWLPLGFELTLVEYIETSGRIQSVDLNYESGANYLHVWQTHMSAAELGNKDPVGVGEPLPDIGWSSRPLLASQVGREGVVEYSARLADDRTVTIDSDLDDQTIRRVLESLYLRSANSGG